jgi:catechol 2,3-dioxygenase-like lactoylglutathione lyase family enzyme
MNIRRLDHASFLVKDVERSRHFYIEVLGLRELARPKSSEVSGAWLTNAEHSFEVHLIGEIEEGRKGQLHGQYRRDEVAQGYGIHVAFEVDDLEATIHDLRAHNVEIIGGPIPRGDGVQRVFICDPDEYIIELFVKEIEI